MADTTALEAVAARHGGSSPLLGTKKSKILEEGFLFSRFFCERGQSGKGVETNDFYAPRPRMILSTNFTKSAGIHARAVSARSGKILLSIASSKSGDVGVGIVSISAGLVVFCLRSS